MGSGPPGSLLLLLLSSLLLVLKCATGESSFIIDTVGLSILPKDNVQSGTEVKIRCDARVSSSNISQLGYLFEFMRDGVEIHTANTTEDSTYYEINPARAVDSGNYQCKVSVKNKRKFSNTKTLDVKGLQTPILHLNNSTPYESEEFKVTCSAPDEKGSLTFNFYKTFRDGQPQRIKKQRSTNNFLETTVTLSHIGDCFLSCDYEISLVSGPTSSNVSNEIQVKVKELNIVPYMTILPNDIYEPDIIEVTCKVQIHLADIEIFLLKDRAVLNRTTGKPLIHRFRPKPTDSGELICKTEWRNVQKENYKTLKVKEVFSKPQLHLEPVDVFEGERFRLHCSVKVFFPQMFDPKTLKYHLYKDGTQLISSATYVAVADRNRNGIYSCKVEGTRISTSFHKESETVTVKAKVPVSDPVLNVVGGKIFVGKGFQLICHSHTGTFPIVYTLFTHNGKKMIRKVSRSEDQATFDVPPIHKTSELKAFLCHASNNPRTPSKTALGQKLLNSTNIIEPTSKPQLTIQPSQDITEGQSMKLVCSVQAGSRPINFTWYQESNGVLASLSTNKLEGYHSMSNAHKKHSGKYYCTSSNPADEPKQSEPVTVEVKMAGWKKALIIVFCFILLLILFLVIALKTRLFHFKRKRTANLSVKSVSTKLERLSLTQAEVIDANATPTMMGKSVWSDHVSGSGGYESDDQNSSTLPEKQAEPEYTEVQIKDADPTKAPAKQSTCNIYSEVRHSQQGVPEVPDGKPVEYAQLNHDGNHQPDDGQVVDQSLTHENTTDSENNTDVHTGDPEEGTCDPAPDC
ncbi:platelet endothelial cell adhesion molecule isoform X3 [Poecilia latipinna]|uniref:platelet endothelial cell adhesion molecule isoform X3 n=1 Tax=Poecilia latipinna TaxID=48699 RepID=UPI00072DEDE7|nr:PREDICTED: platelet endothelial cell adhesion molecule-like isoform X3 [Poecilia latipinna]